jgi:hypothetical protein
LPSDILGQEDVAGRDAGALDGIFSSRTLPGQDGLGRARRLRELELGKMFDGDFAQEVFGKELNVLGALAGGSWMWTLSW